MGAEGGGGRWRKMLPLLLLEREHSQFSMLKFLKESSDVNFGGLELCQYYFFVVHW